jgi:hypothetical protein
MVRPSQCDEISFLESPAQSAEHHVLIYVQKSYVLNRSFSTEDLKISFTLSVTIEVFIAEAMSFLGHALYNWIVQNVFFFNNVGCTKFKRSRILKKKFRIPKCMAICLFKKI